MKLVNIYTDGACSGNQNDTNIGGWGAVLECLGVEKELYGGEINTTNNKMELLALVSALEALKEEGLKIRVFSDSSYLVNCFKDGWHLKWQQNGWKTSKKEPVENKEIWERLIELLGRHEASFYLVKGHVKTPSQADYEKFVGHNGAEFSFEEFARVIEYNNRCDALANKWMDENR